MYFHHNQTGIYVIFLTPIVQIPPKLLQVFDQLKQFDNGKQ